MRPFQIAADVIMGLILGLLLYAAITKTWPSLHHPLVAMVIFSASVVVVLFRRPAGSLLRKRNGAGDD